jgi:hypothetical protein
MEGNRGYAEGYLTAWNSAPFPRLLKGKGKGSEKYFIIFYIGSSGHA